MEDCDNRYTDDDNDMFLVFRASHVSSLDAGSLCTSTR